MSGSKIALVLLASGTSSRFEKGDKLLARYRGNALISYAGNALKDQTVSARIAVVGAQQIDRQKHLSAMDWQLELNTSPERGLSRSLQIGVGAAAQTGADAVMILLADMPLVSADHLCALRAALTPGVQAVMSDLNGVLCPPALFARSTFAVLQTLGGDQGARRVFETLDATRTVPLSNREGVDVDQEADLQHLEALDASR